MYHWFLQLILDIKYTTSLSIVGVLGAFLGISVTFFGYLVNKPLQAAGFLEDNGRG